MKNLINLPYVTLKNININKINYLTKIKLLFIGKLVSIIINKTSKNYFCNLINTIYRDGKIYYQDGKYKFQNKNLEIYFPNKRVLRFVNGDIVHLKDLIETYCLDSIKYKFNDLIVDCGANVGEIFYCFKHFFEQDIRYIGFEPELEVFECLNLNLKEEKTELYNIALSNTKGKKIFYSDIEGANSSLESFNQNTGSDINVDILSSYINEKIKLLKIDAEGHELEVLKGAARKLQNIEYISVDYGPERGSNGEITQPEVTTFLYKHNFQLIKSSKLRMVGLFKNNLFS